MAAGALVLEIVGAVTLAASFMFKRPSSWREETETLAGGNFKLFISMAIQSADAQVGALLLVLGFSGQFLSSLGDADWLSLLPALAIGVGLAAGLVIFLLAYWRPRNVRRALAEQLVVRDRGEWWAAMNNWGAWLDRFEPGFMLFPRRWERRTGEGVDEYGRRLVGRRRWHRITGGVPPPILSTPTPPS